MTQSRIDPTAMIAPLIDQLAQEKPIKQGLAVGLNPTTQWIGEWHLMSIEALEVCAFVTRYDLATVALLDANYEDKTGLSKSNRTASTITDDKLDSNAQHSTLTHALTRLRDLMARRVLILALPSYTPLLRALGFSQIEHLPEHNMIIWQFNILSYKQVPDWLNSKYWANPENWGKYRW